MKRYLALSLLAAITAIGPSCMTGTPTSNVQGIELPSPDPARNEAVVCIYRVPKFVNSASIRDFFIDGRRVGSLRNGTWTYCHLKPGQHTIQQGHDGQPSLHEKAIPFHLARGETKYFQYKATATYADKETHEVPDPTGKKAIQSMQFTTITQ